MGKQAGRAYVIVLCIVCPCFCALFFLLFSCVGEAKGAAKTAVGGPLASLAVWDPSSRWSHNSNHELLGRKDMMQRHAAEEAEVSPTKRQCVRGAVGPSFSFRRAFLRLRRSESCVRRTCSYKQ